MKRKLLSVSLAASMMVTPAFSAVYAETLEPQNEEAVQDTQTDETVVPADQTTEPAEGETTTEPSEETEQPKEETPADETETPAEETETPAETEAPAEEAKEETTEETPAEPAAEETEEAKEETPAAEANDTVSPQREGTEVGCSLTLDTKADGVVTDTLMYQSSKDQYDLQVGGTLNLSDMKGPLVKA